MLSVWHRGNSRCEEWWKKHRAGNQTNWGLNYSFTLTNCATLGKFLKLSEYNFPNPENWKIISMPWRFNTMIYVMHVVECLAHCSPSMNYSPTNNRTGKFCFIYFCCWMYHWVDLPAIKKITEGLWWKCLRTDVQVSDSLLLFCLRQVGAYEYTDNSKWQLWKWASSVRWRLTSYMWLKILEALASSNQIAGRRESADKGRQPLGHLRFRNQVQQISLHWSDYSFLSQSPTVPKL